MNGELRYRSLFVSDLSLDVNEVMLLNAFSSSGPIASVRIVRNRENRQSLGYGYLNFVRESDARNALFNKNFMDINGKQIRLTAAQPNPNIRKANNANVFIKNLDKSVDNKLLYESFKRFGPILSCKVAKEADGQSKGFGFVRFETEQSAIDAIIAMNGRQFNGKFVFCSKFLPKNERQKYLKNSVEVKSYANIYIKNLSPEFNDNSLKQMFITFGPIISVQVIHKKSKHFGFICFSDSVTANHAVKALNGRPLADGCPIYVSRAFKVYGNKDFDHRLAEKRSDGRDICVKYLNTFMDSQKLAQIFSPFGKITGALAYTPSMVSNSWDSLGFVTFSSPESAQKAVRQMNNKVIANKPLFVSLAQPLTERNRRLATNSYLKTKGMSNVWNKCLPMSSAHTFKILA